ncbi:MAG: hypothetical protein ABR551_11135 [Gemmatimonadales bacterium]
MHARTMNGLRVKRRAPMWERTTAWFDLAVILGVFSLGSVLFGRFEQHKPRARRVLKVLIVSALYVWIAQAAGRPWAAMFLILAALSAGVVHLWWLPKHGISGWTAEPYDKYLALVSRAPRAPPES